MSLLAEESEALSLCIFERLVNLEFDFSNPNAIASKAPKDNLSKSRVESRKHVFLSTMRLTFYRLNSQFNFQIQIYLPPSPLPRPRLVCSMREMTRLDACRLLREELNLRIVDAFSRDESYQIGFAALWCIFYGGLLDENLLRALCDLTTEKVRYKPNPAKLNVSPLDRVKLDSTQTSSPHFGITLCSHGAGQQSRRQYTLPTSAEAMVRRVLAAKAYKTYRDAFRYEEPFCEDIDQLWQNMAIVIEDLADNIQPFDLLSRIDKTLCLSDVSSHDLNAWRCLQAIVHDSKRINKREFMLVAP